MFNNNKKRYFIDTNIWYQGKRQPPRKVELLACYPLNDGNYYCIDGDGDSYTLTRDQILVEEN